MRYSLSKWSCQVVKMEFSDYLKQILEKYPKDIGFLSDDFEEHETIQQIRRTFDFESKRQFPQFQVLLNSLVEKYFMVLSNYGLSHRSLDITIRVTQDADFFIDISISMLVPFHCIICWRPESSEKSYCQIEVCSTDYNQYLDKINQLVKQNFDSELIDNKTISEVLLGIEVESISIENSATVYNMFFATFPVTFLK
ncbi:hypothetical protein J2Y60_001498 [Arcicella sp. BE140]|nr:hypothetical protein [Arcicella sp. BE140]MDR6822659.1 hypothetical protein [Arcicella sp. BE139]